jgi:Zn-finger nucleic acid-binding protein
MMHCPLCLDSPLEPKFVGGVEVDICPRCRGIWLDRGEIDRFAEDTSPQQHRPRPIARDDRSDDERPRGKQRTSTAKRLADLLDDVLDL